MINKNLNNWLDEVEGLPKNTTNNNIAKEYQRQQIRLIQAINPSAMFCDECNEDLRDCECNILPF